VREPPGAIVLAGGLGTRLAGVSGGLPKCLMPVAGRPFLGLLLCYLARWGVRRTVLALGHGAARVERELPLLLPAGMDADVVAEPTPLGTGGAIRLAAERARTWPVLALNGDSFLDLDLDALLATHAARGARVTMALAEVPDTGRFGRVELSADGQVMGFAEKSATGSGLINGGMYVLDREAVDAIPPGRSSFEYDVLPRHLGAGVWGFVARGFFVDIGVPEDYARLVARPAPLLEAAGVEVS